MVHALSLAARATGQVGLWLANRRMSTFLLITAAIAFLKSTFFWSGSFFYQEAAAFPDPVTHFSTNFMAVLTHKVAGEQVSLVFLGSSILALAGAVFLLIKYLWAETPDTFDRRIVILLAFGWPGVLVVLPWIGNGTAFLPLFIVLAVLAKRTWVWFAGILGAVGTHPEHALVGFALLTLLAVSPEFKRFRTRAITGAAVSLVTVILTITWLGQAGVSGRSNEFTSGFDFALPFALRNGILGTYTWWGLWWLVVMITLTIVSRRSRWLIVLASIALPAIFTAATADYTRVFVGITLPVGIALVTNLFNSKSRDSDENELIAPELALGSWFVAFLLLPNIIIMMPGDGIPLPGSYWVGLVQNYILPIF